MIEPKLIPGFSAYAATSEGRIISLATGAEVPQFLWGQYLAVRLRRGIGRRERSLHVHRLVAAAFVDNPDCLPVVNHIDGDKRNNLSENLAWVSHSENQSHAIRTGLRRVKIMPTDRDKIRERYESQSPPVTLKQLADEYGVTPGRISQIVSRRLEGRTNAVA